MANDTAANCECFKMKGDKGSTYSGKYCECCEEGECQKDCNPYFGTSKLEKAELCFGRGKCNCKATCEVRFSILFETCGIWYCSWGNMWSEGPVKAKSINKLFY